MLAHHIAAPRNATKWWVCRLRHSTGLRLRSTPHCGLLFLAHLFSDLPPSSPCWCLSHQGLEAHCILWSGSNWPGDHWLALLPAWRNIWPLGPRLGVPFAPCPCSSCLPWGSWQGLALDIGFCLLSVCGSENPSSIDWRIQIHLQSAWAFCLKNFCISINKPCNKFPDKRHRSQDHQLMVMKQPFRTLTIWRAFSRTARSFCSDKRDLAMLPGATSFFSFILETAVRSKLMKISLEYMAQTSGNKLYIQLLYLLVTLENQYLKICLFLRISGHESSANAPDNTRSSNNLLWNSWLLLHILNCSFYFKFSQYK